MRKYFMVIILALTMILGGTVTAFADDGYSIVDYFESQGWDSSYIEARDRNGFDYTAISEYDDNNHEAFTIFEYGDGVKMYYADNGSGGLILHFVNISDSSKYVRSLCVNQDGSITQNWSKTLAPNKDETIGITLKLPRYSSCDVYSDVECTQVFFHKVLPTQTLQSVAKKVEMAEVMKQIVGLIPLVIGLVVLAIALRKALAVLQTALHRA